MKSKSPFSKKSPLGLQVYRGDTYEQPDTVITKTVGEQVGKAITGIADNAVDYMNTKGKLAKGEKLQNKINKERLDISNRNRLEKSSAEPAREVMRGLEYDMNKPLSKLTTITTIRNRPSNLSKSSDTFSDKNAWDSNRNNVQNDPRFKGPGGREKFYVAATEYRKKEGTGINTTIDGGKTRFQDGKRMLAVNMNGSPAKHNESAVGSIAGAQPQSSAISIAGNMLGGNTKAGIRAIGQKPTGSIPGGAGLFGVATQAASGLSGMRAAAASPELLPSPNQVVESGSYAGTGDRMLEMDSNPVGNQSIGRDTYIASQLFGSGQRASMLAMKGTPLYDKGHGAKQAHTHPSKTTTKISGKGEMPGSSYVKGDHVDEDDLLDVGLQRHNATLAQSDSKGTFIKEMPDSGPGSNIETDKGFGEKIRLNNMSRPDYTSNEGSQMDPHDFLFKNTPKK